MPDQPLPRIAAVVSDGETDVDALLADFTRSLAGRGWRVRGLVQEKCHAGEVCDIVLADLQDGRRYPITQNLGSGSAACRLDAQAMTEAGAVLRRIARDGADLAVANRFGKLEAEGEGFAAELLELMSQGIPVLTVVPETHLPAWRRFTGGLAAELSPRSAALEGWFAALEPVQA